MTQAVTLATLGNGPAFRAYPSGSQTISSATATKVLLQTELFDTNNCFDSTTNYRFTPTVAGYYQVNGNVGMSNNAIGVAILAMIYKNGTSYSLSQSLAYTNVSSVACVSSLVYLNGSTDYVELYVYNTGVSSYSTLVTTFGTADCTSFSANLVRGA
jgi:hypothetical protein